MKDETLRQTFLTTCVGYQVFWPIDPPTGFKKFELVKRPEIEKLIPKICSSLGISVSEADVEALITRHGTLNESALLNLKDEEITHAMLTIATVLMAIRYRRSAIFVEPAIIVWMRAKFIKVKIGHDKPACHAAFLDWFAIVNKHLFSLVQPKATAHN